MNLSARRAGWAAAALVPLIPLAFLFLRTPEATLLFKLLIATLLLVAAWRPWTAFATAVALMPVAPALSVVVTGTRSQPAAVVDAVALVALVAWCRFRLTSEGPSLSPWRACGVLLAAVVLASVVAQFLVHLSLGPAAAWPALMEWLPQPFEPSAFHPVFAAAPLLVGVALAVALVDFTRHEPSRAQAAARLIAIGATGAAMVNVLRFVQLVRHAGQPLSSLGRAIVEARIDAQLNDVNATGPYLAMVAPIAMGLAVAEPKRRPLWIVSALLIGIGVWLTGSRSALGTAVLAVGAVSLVLGSRRARIIWLGALAAALAAAVIIAPQRMRMETIEKGLSERVQYAQTSLRMFATAPAFGVGIGRYFDRSTEFAPPELIATWPEAAPRENAHNYYLQVLAEIGAIGFLAFCAVIAWPLVPRRQGERVPRVLVVSMTAGIAAMLVAFLATHPLLVRPIAYLFFLVVGLLMAARTQPETRRPLLLAGVTALAVIGIAASVPYQAREARDSANLENVTINTSRWNPPLDGERHVTAGRTARVFVDAHSKGAVLPLRLPRGGTPVRDVSIYLDGKLANVVRVRPDAWTYAVLPLPEGRPRFRAVDFVVEGEIAPGDYPDALVFIGRFRTVERR